MNSRLSNTQCKCMSNGVTQGNLAVAVVSSQHEFIVQQNVSCTIYHFDTPHIHLEQGSKLGMNKET